MEHKSKTKIFLNNFEIYASTCCFFVLMVALTVQVVGRYVLQHSITWMEELATIMFVWMIYLGVSGAVSRRKHLRIDFLLDMMPFRGKRFCLILSNVIFAVFNVYICIVFFDVIRLLGSSVTTMLRLPKVAVYGIIPFALILSIVRLIQDTIVLMKEDEQQLGTSVPALDLAACEQDFRDKQFVKQQSNDDGGNN